MIYPNSFPTAKPDSLGRKFSLAVFILICIVGLAVGYGISLALQDKEYEEAEAKIKHIAGNYAARFNDDFLKKEQKAIAANRVVSQSFSDSLQNIQNQKSALSGKNIRYQDEYSALYAADTTRLSTLQLINESEQLWRQLSPVVLQDFYNFYFFTSDSFIRIAPSQWVASLPAIYELRKAHLLDLVQPENNPTREPKWSEIYYDEVLNQHVISFVIPVYVNDVFIGATASDVRLSYLHNFLHILSGTTLTLFDDKGRYVSPEAFFDESQTHDKTALNAYKTYALAYLANPWQSDAAKQVLPNQIIATSEIERLGWHLNLATDKEKIDAMLGSVRLNAMLLILGGAIAFSVVMFWLINHFILKRINRLSTAIGRLSKGDLEQVELDTKNDEIGLLNQAFIRVSNEIATLVQGLQTRIEEKELAERLARKLSKAVSFSSSGIVLTDPSLRIEYANPYLTDMLGMTTSQIQHRPLTSLFSEEMHHQVSDINLTLSERHHWRGDILLQFADKQLWVSLAIAPIRDEKGAIINYVAAMQDISFIKQSQKQMEELAYYDVLTGLANRGYFRDQLRKAMAMALRGNYAFALLYFDLDEFKRINDTLGHDAGDLLLQTVAKRLQNRLRQEDTIARLGGDEFAIILSGVTSRSQASLITTNLQTCFAEPVKLGNYDVEISASIGITMAPEDASEEEMLLKHADLAMYEAKARGKNTFHFFSNDLNEAAKARLLIENQLREAIREQQFLLYYQPKYDLRDGRLIGYETLIRWLRSDNTLVSPQQFIPIAESTGLIVQIGEWVILEACRFLARQSAKGAHISVAINLSARQFADDNLPEIVERIITRTGVDPSLLIFEITESMLMGDTDAAINQLNQLKRLGVSLSIDDFGTGYSSLSYLKRFPVDELKIDRSFVQDIPDDSSNMDIVVIIIAMAQKMNLRVVAEGVETSEQVEFLKKNACYQVQGYYFSMPLAEQELGRLSYVVNS